MNFTSEDIKRLASFPEQNPNPVIEISLPGTLLYCNPAAKKHFPTLEKEGVAHEIFNSVRSYFSETKRNRLDGLRTLHTYAGHIFDQKIFFLEEEKIVRLYCSDITEQKKNEERLAQLALFPMQNPNPVIEVNYESGEITFMNPAGKIQFPALREADVTHPLFSEIRKRLSEKKDFSCEILIHEHIFEQKVFFIPDSALARIYLHDLTERKKNEKKMARLASFPEQNPSPIVELDTEGNITYLNTACHKLYPEILSEKFEHGLLQPFRQIYPKYLSGEISDHAHEIKVGEHHFLQRSRFMPENSLVRIFNIDITAQKKSEEIIREKNKDITDSINYALRIQQSILPTKDELNSALKDYFVLFMPKDIVSGDFYWSVAVTSGKNELAEKLSIMAAVDCTGHGVPGALMSIVGNTLLNQTIKNSEVNSPAEALDFLNHELPKNLKSREGEDIKDGMDMTMIAFSREKMRLYFAGANNPIYILSGGQLTEIKGDKQPISGSLQTEKRKFTLHTIDLKKGDQVYLFTDGFADQFGGPKGKKFKYKQMQEVILANSHLSMEEQDKELRKAFIEWKGNLEQVDDVLIIGIRI
jgi:serine phosphatase RsbU (regulator of sigma subunit)/PAS domain-containing protein